MPRVDIELVERGLARSRAHAAELVKAGRVRSGRQPVRKPSSAIDPDAPLKVTADPSDPEYASRAAFKLAGAIDALGATGAPKAQDATGAPNTPGAAAAFDGQAGGIQERFVSRLQGARCLDLGASTGGFTDVLLRNGAAHVTALDVGRDQIIERLRLDGRVTVIEGQNARELAPELLPYAPDLVVGDLSFISLRLILPSLDDVLDPSSKPMALLLVKPQFEVGRELLGSGGVVREGLRHAAAIKDVARAGAANGFIPLAVIPSPLVGTSGNREFFLLLDFHGVDADNPLSTGTSEPLDRAVDGAVAWQPAGGPPPVEWVADSTSTGGEQ